MTRNRRYRRQGRAEEFGARFGARHPRLSAVILCVLLAGATAIYGYQLGYGAYLGTGWAVAACAGVATAAGLNAAVVIGRRRHWRAAGRLTVAWLVLAVMSASAIKYPFPHGRYGGLQAFFNIVHAATLGFELVTCTAITALLGYLLVRPGGLTGRRAGQEPGGAGLPARLRFPGAERPVWRAGRLTAASGTVTWRSWKGDAEVDLTAACQALPSLPAGSRERQPRTTTLATAGGLAEVDVSPRALVALAGGMHLPHPAALPGPVTAD